ncbi:MAG: hypothetical protein K8J08_14770, partial [Thermoanaerobaculia bacterium]|nr:hypothetical protein [Thermoanaerobaculia bacterium]
DSSGPGGFSGCNDQQEGWADVADSWAESTWSATALGSAGLAGQTIGLDVTYSTDAALAERGFWFDEVTVTNFSLLVADTQTNACVATPIFADGFESGNTTAWSNSVP